MTIKMHWLPWGLLCSRKNKGGLGYRSDLHLFSLARQGWRLLTDPESLCAQVLRAKYFPDGQMLKVKEKPGISYSWRSIVNCARVAGVEIWPNLENWWWLPNWYIYIWVDPWIQEEVMRRPVTPRSNSPKQSIWPHRSNHQDLGH
jgi:hypothetical protein